jgi:PPK2 family polyphosphate:nucleotide phosphotransferase
MAKKRREAVPARLSELLRVPGTGAHLHHAPTRATPGFDGTKRDAAAQLPDMAARLSDLQEQLFAERRRSLLLVLQGLDTAGKGGTVRHVVGEMDPGGLKVAHFGVPSRDERRHDFLWRIRRELPPPGWIGVFDRSHYEDVVTVRVTGAVERRTWSRRFASINRFESQLAQQGTRVVKVYLHISPEESRERLLARLDDPTKRWKFNPGDLATRERWEEYLTAYEEALTRCSTDLAPWFVVPADHKWYRNWAVTRLLVEQLEEMALTWPEPTYDVAEQRTRLLAMP